VGTPEKALAQRIRELRRRHFGSRGKEEFARKLGLPPGEYERFERGTLPAGDVLVRMCEVTGEDLQWLLTGVAARGTVVISGARGRHQNLVTQIAQALDAQPQLAAPLEAFLDLLLQGGNARQSPAVALPTPGAETLIPLFSKSEWPDPLPDPDGPEGGCMLARICTDSELAHAERTLGRLAEPAMVYNGSTTRDVAMLVVPDAAGAARRYVLSREVACCFPAAFGVVLDDDTMEPMFAAGDAALVAVGAAPRIGQPALCKFANSLDDRCRIWLGEDERTVHLGRVCDGEHEELPRAQLRWSLEVLYRVAQAA
jgi:transcriptional regulator with XRE-family HTH domain